MQYTQYASIVWGSLQEFPNKSLTRYLAAMGKMLNLFEATGHQNFAKDSKTTNWISLTLPNLQAYYVHRTNKFWAGSWTLSKNYYNDINQKFGTVDQRARSGQKHQKSFC